MTRTVLVRAKTGFHVHTFKYIRGALRTSPRTMSFSFYCCHLPVPLSSLSPCGCRSPVNITHAHIHHVCIPCARHSMPPSLLVPHVLRVSSARKLDPISNTMDRRRYYSCNSSIRLDQEAKQKRTTTGRGTDDAADGRRGQKNEASAEVCEHCLRSCCHCPSFLCRSNAAFDVRILVLHLHITIRCCPLMTSS